MTETELKVFETSAKATVKRVSAENTWLRHSLLEMELLMEAMKAQMAQLETRARALKKTFSAMPSTPAKQPRTKK